MSRSYYSAMCMGLVLMAPSGVLHAQEGAEAFQQQLALDALKQGIAAFDNADYARAILAFRESYSAYPTAIASFNLAEAYIRQAEVLLDAEMLDLAEQALNRSVSDEPKVPLDESRLSRIQELRQSIETLRTDLSCQKAVKAYQEELELWQNARQVCKEKASSVRFDALGKTGWGVAAMGGATLLVSGFYGIRAGQQYEALQPPHTEGRDAYDQAVDEFETTQRRGKATLYVGGGLMLTGLTMAIIDGLSVDTVYEGQDCENVMQRPAPAEPVCMAKRAVFFLEESTPRRASTTSPRFRVQAGPYALTGTLRF